MVYKQNAEVVELKQDVDMMGGKSAMVTFAFRLPSPPMPPHLKNAYPPPPIPVAYKHMVHLIIPQERWMDQYKLWEEWSITINDNGALAFVKEANE